MKASIAVVLLGVVSAASARAETYWLHYEGNDFPENHGWTQIRHVPYADRWIEDGVFVLDASADPHTCEWYEYYTDDALWPMPDVAVPDPPSYFFLQWRMKVDDYSGSAWGGPVMGVFSHDGWGAAFFVTDDTIRYAYDPGLIAPIEPNEFHEFEMRSPDMRTFELYIDDALAFEGTWYDSQLSNKVGWGDDTTGASSISRWDYVRMGIAPEPNSLFMMVLLLGGMSATGQRNR